MSQNNFIFFRGTNQKILTVVAVRKEQKKIDNFLNFIDFFIK